VLAVRRAREACVALGRERAEAVRAALVAGGGPAIAERVRVVPARFSEVESGRGRVTAAVEKKKS
jgi:hypothetical protein